MTRAEVQSLVVEALRSCLGTQWHHTGRVKNAGLDCIGLIVVAYRECGFDLQDHLDYSLNDEYALLTSKLLEQCDVVDDMHPIQVGDILVFRHRMMNNHVGVFLGDGRMIHSYNGSTIYGVVEHDFTPQWQERLAGVYRIKEELWPL